jgi:polyisoprenoid-binding protein YceI
MTTTTESITQLPIGVWNVDPESSELGFGARGMFGLVPVHGHFGDFGGTLTTDNEGSRGELTVQAATLDTHNAKRDAHLRSGDFFDVESHPVFTFELTGVKPGAAGALLIDRLSLATTLDVDRAAAGLGWSKMGMIKGKAHLTARLTLRKQD